MKKNLYACLVLALVVTSQLGCGASGPPDKRPERVAFAGTAKLNGAGVEEAFITFHPVDAKGYGASAKTDANGKFVMGTFKSDDGVVPGDYTVTVTKGKEAAAATAPVFTDDPAYNGAPPETKTAVENDLPAKFSDPTTSGVKVTVTEANNDFVLEFK
jgi:hypothetical protein